MELGSLKSPLKVFVIVIMVLLVTKILSSHVNLDSVQHKHQLYLTECSRISVLACTLLMQTACKLHKKTASSVTRTKQLL